MDFATTRGQGDRLPIDRQFDLQYGDGAHQSRLGGHDPEVRRLNAFETLSGGRDGLNPLHLRRIRPAAVQSYQPQNIIANMVNDVDRLRLP
ncbi:MAG: hypothetical protein ACRYGP_31940 [Janthinobacterium lividum]